VKKRQLFSWWNFVEEQNRIIEQLIRTRSKKEKKRGKD